MIYPYRCTACQWSLEVWGSPDHEAPPCPECGEPMARDYSAQDIRVGGEITRAKVGGYRMSERAEQAMRDETREHGERNSQVVVDSKGSPFLNDQLQPVSRKEWDDGYKRKFRDAGLAEGAEFKTQRPS